MSNSIYPGVIASGQRRLKDVAWYSSNSGGFPHEVMTRDPNGFNLFDMGGNVEEWVTSPFRKVIDRHRTIKGGHAKDGPSGLRIDARRYGSKSTKSPLLGFRVVRNAEKPTLRREIDPEEQELRPEGFIDDRNIKQEPVEPKPTVPRGASFDGRTLDKYIKIVKVAISATIPGEKQAFERMAKNIEAQHPDIKAFRPSRVNPRRGRR
jgi:hypothetical protein